MLKNSTKKEEICTANKLEEDIMGECAPAEVQNESENSSASLIQRFTAVFLAVNGFLALIV